MSTTLTMSDGTYTGTTTIVPYDGMRVWMDGHEQVFMRDQFWGVKDLESGRVRIGGPGDWFARITWAPDLWFMLRSPRFQRMMWR